MGGHPKTYCYDSGGEHGDEGAECPVGNISLPQADYHDYEIDYDNHLISMN
jgi:hypothetical protein